MCKIILKVLSFSLLLVFISACDKGRTEHFSEEEAISYLNISSYNEKFEYIEESYDEKEDSKKFKFKTVSQNPVTFNVVSERKRSSMLGCLGRGCEYALSDTYLEESASQVLSDYSKKNKNTDIIVDIEKNTVNVSYRNYEEISNAVKNASSVYLELLEKLPSGADFTMQVGYISNDYTIEGPIIYIREKDFDIDLKIKELKKEYSTFTYTYRLVDEKIPSSVISTIMKKEIDMHIRYGSQYQIHILNGEDTITYGVYYDLLKVIDYPVEGEYSNYSVHYGEDTYYFSYQFYDEQEGSTYYLKNEEKTYTYRYKIQEDLMDVHISNLNQLVCTYSEEDISSLSICFSKSEEEYYAKEEIEDVVHSIAKQADYIKILTMDCNGICTLGDHENQTSYLELEEEFGKTLEGYEVHTIDGNTYIADETFKDKKGNYYYLNFKKMYLPNANEYRSVDNLEELFQCKFIYNEVENIFYFQTR